MAKAMGQKDSEERTKARAEASSKNPSANGTGALNQRGGRPF
jgi:hypothetical protein